jgi:predicted transposase/invertase (TIGR01784 family)
MHQIDTAHPIDVRIANQGLVMFNSPNILPEYFFISVPKFNNIINQEIDEWLYVMKNSDVKKDFKSPYMAKVASRLAVLKMNDQERNEYFHYMKEAVHSQDTLNAAKTQGIAEGEINKSIEIALEMLSDGQSIDTIMKYTKLTEEQIKNLR